MNEKLKKEEEEQKKLRKLEKEKGTVKGAFKDFFGLSKQPEKVNNDTISLVSCYKWSDGISEGNDI